MKINILKKKNEEVQRTWNIKTFEQKRKTKKSEDFKEKPNKNFSFHIKQLQPLAFMQN